ncbi:hypothetical protein [Rhizobium hidalgonense]|uniref:hypothetical protein n=1 Tax=Rhizobium hidalgonense TaxID=1538159 RepID=UPI0028719EB6|nr:hypothetical protein [Rhizobium hidalgonense]MDR9809561.1 hypothetical protein [Rhizobium hidalgonense]
MKTILSFAIGAVIVMGTMFYLWAISLGAIREGGISYWIPDMYELKLRAARAVGDKPKVVVVSGSNAMFGLDSETLSKVIGKPVVNLAVHAGLPFEYIAGKGLEAVQSGDTVVMPLEFEYYRRKEAPSEFELVNMETWGGRYALGSITRAYSYFRNTSMLRVLRDDLSPSLIPPHETPPNLMAAAEANTERGIAKWVGYEAASLNLYGDALIDHPGAFEEDRDYIPAPARPEAIRKIVRFKKAVEAMGATFWLTWPVFIQNPSFDLRTKHANEAISDLRETVASYGLQINCEPANFQFNRNLFLDTYYHLGLEGAERRTVKLAECLTGKPSGLDPLKVTAERRRQAADYDKLANP